MCEVHFERNYLWQMGKFPSDLYPPSFRAFSKQAIGKSLPILFLVGASSECAVVHLCVHRNFLDKEDKDKWILWHFITANRLRSCIV